MKFVKIGDVILPRENIRFIIQNGIKMTIKLTTGDSIEYVGKLSADLIDILNES